MLVEALEHRIQTIRDMAADNLRGHRKFRDCTSRQGREMADWYEGRYMAFKRSASMIRDTLEMYSDI